MAREPAPDDLLEFLEIEGVGPKFRRHGTSKREGDRREAWRRYEISQRHWKLSLAIMSTPPKGWADDLYADTYQPPSDGWPPWS